MIFITWASDVSIPYLAQVCASAGISSIGAILVSSKNRINRLNTLSLDSSLDHILSSDILYLDKKWRNYWCGTGNVWSPSLAYFDSLWSSYMT